MPDTRPRRTFAVISHPDAGKSTLTEALALHARVITEAGAVHGKGDRRATVSDWMAMEKARGISITSAALQFVYRDHVINLVDTPGHSDFSEDTYRVLSAVDSAVMLVDAGKGLEPQTLKLFKVCALRGIPVMTVINKWDRPGLSALELMDLIQEKIKLRPTPLTWPVGEAGDFRGVLDRRTGEFVKYTRTAGGATRAPERRMGADEVEDDDALLWAAAVEEHELLTLDEADHDQERFLAGETTPVMFASALQNFGVAQLLDLLLDLAPDPSATEGVDGSVREIADDFSAFVFKVQSGMNNAHRDRLAYARVVSGTFERGMVVTHAASGRPFATKFAQSVFGRDTAVGRERRARRHHRLRQRAGPAGRRHRLRRRRHRVPARPQLRPRALRDRQRRRHQPLQAVPHAASSSSTRRAWCRCCAPTCAATRTRSSRPSARCSSRSSRTG